MLGFNDSLTLVGHFVSSPREREKRDIGKIVEEMKGGGGGGGGQGREGYRNEREGTEEI